MAMDYAILRTELLTDPTGLGYAPMIAEGNDQGPADTLNLIRGTISVFRNDLQAWELIAATVKTDWDALAAGDKQLFLALVSAQRLDATSATLRQIIIALFPNGSATRTNLTAVASRSGSRAEQLFGLGVRVSATDIARALRG